MNFLEKAMEAAKAGGGGFVKMPEGWNTGRIKTDRRKLKDGRDVADVTVTDEQGRSAKSTFFLTDAAAWRIGKLADVCELHKVDNPRIGDMDGKAIDVYVIHKQSDKDPAKFYAEFDNEFRPASRAIAEAAPEPTDAQPDYTEGSQPADDDDGFAF